MLKKPTLLKTILFLILPFFISCSDQIDNSFESKHIEKIVSLEKQTDNLLNQIHHIIEDQYLDQQNINNYLSKLNCDLTIVEQNKKWTRILDFNNSKSLIDNQSIEGKLIISNHLKHQNTLTNLTITFEDFYLDSNKIEGDISLIIDHNNINTISSKIDLIIEFSNTISLKRTGTFTREKNLIDSSSKQTPFFKLSGGWQSESSSFGSYNLNIESPVHLSMSQINSHSKGIISIAEKENSDEKHLINFQNQTKKNLVNNTLSTKNQKL